MTNITERDEFGNPVRKPEFIQVCVWPGTLVTPEEVPRFETQLLARLKTRVQFLETVYTKPSTDRYGINVPGTGGRADVLFAVHNEDIGQFAIPRLLYGIRWIEDALSNEPELYEPRLRYYKCWETV